MRTLLISIAGLALVGPTAPQTYPLDSAKGFELHNAAAEAVTFQGKKAIKVVSAGEAPRGRGEANRVDHLVISPVHDFSSGTIEVDLAGQPSDAAGGGARGFVGVAFRLQPDNKTYDTFYLRPTNGRADDQQRRNHSAQYISHPDWPWFRLRKETPGKYESYVDIEPAKWIHVKITVDGDKARLYVNHNDQPTLVVDDVKSGASAKGAIALWFEGSTVAHFANLEITEK